MRSSLKFALVLGTACLAWAQGPSPKIDLGGKDSPITLVTYDPGDSKATPRGAAYLVDFHPTLSLRNSSSKRIRSVTLLVQGQENSPGGKASVSVPSLDIAPGDTFPLRINQTLLGSNPSIEVNLDGVLFEDLSFYGPDRLHLQYNMTVWELQARQDRKFYKSLLEASGGQALQNAMISLEHQAEMTQPNVQMARGRSTNIEPGQDMQFAFLRLPDSPLELASGQAHVAANVADGPSFSVHNISKRPVRHLEIGWILKDQAGREFLAASLPADLNLAPGQSGQVVEDASLRLRGQGSILGMKGFIASAEFADGTYWIPSRKELEDPELRGLVAPSPEEQRLLSIYKKKGPNGLIEELKKF